MHEFESSWLNEDQRYSLASLLYADIGIFSEHKSLKLKTATPSTAYLVLQKEQLHNKPEGGVTATKNQTPTKQNMRISPFTNARK